VSLETIDHDALDCRDTVATLSNMTIASPYDRDPPWGEPPEATDPGQDCAMCGERRYERCTDDTCGGCGFKFIEIAQAVRIVVKVLGIYDVENVDQDRFRKALDAVIGETVDHGL
jgi:hypothetical protein